MLLAALPATLLSTATLAPLLVASLLLTAMSSVALLLANPPFAPLLGSSLLIVSALLLSPRGRLSMMLTLAAPPAALLVPVAFHSGYRLLDSIDNPTLLTLVLLTPLLALLIVTLAVLLAALLALLAEVLSLALAELFRAP